MENNIILNLDLALAILKEEDVLDEIAVLELSTINKIVTIEELFLELEKRGIILDSKNKVDMENIYGIISSEMPCVSAYRVIKVKTAYRVRSLIGKWNPPSLGQMKINDVINDIYTRTRNKIQGEEYYYTGRGKEKNSRGKYIYKLIISGEVAVFLDFNRIISYHILNG